MPPRTRPPVRLVRSLIGLGLFLLACGGGADGIAPPPPAPPPAPPPPPPAPPPAPVASVALSPDTATIALGAIVQLAATLKDAQGVVLTGRTITWTSTAPAVASVSAAGLVTAVQVGRSSIVAASEGKSDTATVSVSPGPVQVTLQNGAGQTATIGSAGGTIVATGAGGTLYTLVIPPLALMQPVAITMTPLGGVTGLPLSGGFVAGADFAPSGLAFAVPATLTITTSRQPGANQRLAGFSYQGTGTGLALTPVKGTANTIVLPVLHFSGVGAGFGTTQDIEAFWFGTNPPPTTSAFYAATLTVASGANPRDGAFELQVMEDWFDAVILPQLIAAGSDTELLLAAVAYQDWFDTTPDLLGIFGVIPGGVDAASIVSRDFQWRQLFATKVKQAIAGNEQICAAPGPAAARLAALDNAIFWHRLIDLTFGLASPQNGLDLASFQAGLCAHSVTESLSFADPLDNAPNTLDATFKLIFTGGQVVVPANFFVIATGSNATLLLPDATAANPVGFYHGTVTPGGGSGSVIVDLEACYAGPMITATEVPPGFFHELCHNEHITRETLQPFFITTTSLPAGKAGVPYQTQLHANRAVLAASWEFSCEQFLGGTRIVERGLLIDRDTGVISGKPGPPGTYTCTAEAVSPEEPHIDAAKQLMLTIAP